jgi:hypothetical protein
MRHLVKQAVARVSAQQQAADWFIMAREVYAEGDERSAFDYAHRAREILASEGIHAATPPRPRTTREYQDMKHLLILWLFATPTDGTVDPVGAVVVGTFKTNAECQAAGQSAARLRSFQMAVPGKGIVLPVCSEASGLLP